MTRELDAEVAEKVMGIERVEKRNRWKGGALVEVVVGQPRGGYLSELPPYSTDIASAFQVVEKMRERGYLACLIQATDHWEAQFAYIHDGNEPDASAVATDAPEAICRAALVALRQDLNEGRR